MRSSHERVSRSDEVHASAELFRGMLALHLAVMVPCAVILASCTSQSRPVGVTNAVPATNPQAELAAAVLREDGMQLPSLKRGQDVVMGVATCKTGSTCFSCFQCHGVRGEGGAVAALPRLAGQDQRYLYRSLEQFASGERANATMHEVAAALTEEQKQDVALYYASVTAPAPLLRAAKDDARAQAGLDIEQHGVPNTGVPACGTCHSADLRTQGPPYPYIAGQYADYLRQQLDNFRVGTRRGADAQIMQAVARGLSDEQADAVSVHFASQTPPQRATQQAQR